MSDQQSTTHQSALGPPPESLLSPRRAFIVQFRIEANGTREHFTGRVEHLVSGHATRFHSPDDLLAFFTRILANMETSDREA